MKFGNEFWLILFQEYISPKLFAVRRQAKACSGLTAQPSGAGESLQWSCSWPVITSPGNFISWLLLVWQICSLNWDLEILTWTLDSFVETLSTSFDGPVAKYLLVMQGAWVQIRGVFFITFSWRHHWEPRFKSGFYNSFRDYLVPDRISWMTLEICKWNLGTSFG